MKLGADVIRGGPRPLEGPLRPGEVFAWEPDLPHAAELLILRRVYQDELGRSWVEAWDTQYRRTYRNEEGRFREACYRTLFNLFPAERPSHLAPPPAPDPLGR